MYAKSSLVHKRPSYLQHFPTETEAVSWEIKSYQFTELNPTQHTSGFCCLGTEQMLNSYRRSSRGAKLIY